MARREKVVVAKRGCTCCGTGCVVPLVVLPGLSFAFSGVLGALAAVVLSLPLTIASMHALAWVGRRGTDG